MAWAIRSVANSKGIASNYRDAFMLRRWRPSLWLSSLALFSSQIALIMAMVVLAWQVRHADLPGVESILKVEESLVAFDIAYTVTALGLIAWALLVMLDSFRRSPEPSPGGMRRPPGCAYSPIQGSSGRRPVPGRRSGRSGCA